MLLKLLNRNIIFLFILVYVTGLLVVSAQELKDFPYSLVSSNKNFILLYKDEWQRKRAQEIGSLLEDSYSFFLTKGFKKPQVLLEHVVPVFLEIQPHPRLGTVVTDIHVPGTSTPYIVTSTAYESEVYKWLIPHELVHLFQLDGYKINTTNWVLEATAVGLENNPFGVGRPVDPDISNFYRKLQEGWPLLYDPIHMQDSWELANHQYESGLFFQYIDKIDPLAVTHFFEKLSHKEKIIHNNFSVVVNSLSEALPADNNLKTVIFDFFTALEIQENTSVPRYSFKNGEEIRKRTKINPYALYSKDILASDGRRFFYATPYEESSQTFSSVHEAEMSPYQAHYYSWEFVPNKDPSAQHLIFPDRPLTVLVQAQSYSSLEGRVIEYMKDKNKVKVEPIKFGNQNFVAIDIDHFGEEKGESIERLVLALGHAGQRLDVPQMLSQPGSKGYKISYAFKPVSVYEIKIRDMASKNTAAHWKWKTDQNQRTLESLIQKGAELIIGKHYEIEIGLSHPLAVLKMDRDQKRYDKYLKIKIGNQDISVKNFGYEHFGRNWKGNFVLEGNLEEKSFMKIKLYEGGVRQGDTNPKTMASVTSSGESLWMWTGYETDQDGDKYALKIMKPEPLKPTDEGEGTSGGRGGGGSGKKTSDQKDRGGILDEPRERTEFEGYRNPGCARFESLLKREYDKLLSEDEAIEQKQRKLFEEMKEDSVERSVKAHELTLMDDRISLALHVLGDVSWIFVQEEGEIKCPQILGEEKLFPMDRIAPNLCEDIKNDCTQSTANLRTMIQSIRYFVSEAIPAYPISPCLGDLIATYNEKERLEKETFGLQEKLRSSSKKEGKTSPKTRELIKTLNELTKKYYCISAQHNALMVWVPYLSVSAGYTSNPRRAPLEREYWRGSVDNCNKNFWLPGGDEKGCANPCAHSCDPAGVTVIELQDPMKK